MQLKTPRLGKHNDIQNDHPWPLPDAHKPQLIVVEKMISCIYPSQCAICMWLINLYMVGSKRFTPNSAFGEFSDSVFDFSSSSLNLISTSLHSKLQNALSPLQDIKRSQLNKINPSKKPISMFGINPSARTNSGEKLLKVAS